MNSAVTGFTGHALQSTELMTDAKSEAVLLAGPADVRVPSLNTLAGHKSLFDEQATNELSSNPHENHYNNAILALWAEAVRWFRDSMLNEPSGERFHVFMREHYPEYIRSELTDEDKAKNRQKILFLRSFMQTWIQWFADPHEAHAFMGNTLIDGISNNAAATPQALVQHYETLSDALHPAGKMPPAHDSNPTEQALWKFPTFT
jgi:hypothetical protein